MTVGPGHYAILSAAIFSLGLYGVLTRRNAFAALLAMALLFLAPVIALVGFAHLGGSSAAPPLGDALALFAVVAMVAELVLGTALVMLLWRRLGSVDIDDLQDVEG